MRRHAVFYQTQSIERAIFDVPRARRFIGLGGLSPRPLAAGVKLATAAPM